MLVDQNKSCPRTTSRDALQRIVDHDGEVIAGRHFLARERRRRPTSAATAVMVPVWPCGPAPVSVQVSDAGLRHRRIHGEPQAR